MSSSENQIYRHGAPLDWEAAKGEPAIEQISTHIKEHLGNIETVYHEIVSDAVHIDVHFVKPTDAFPFSRLVTSGMSDLPMAVPPEADRPKFMELMVTLPAYWRLDKDSMKDETSYWPIRLIKTLARFPHKYNTWLGWGHTIPNGDPPQPYAKDTKLAGSIIIPPMFVPEAFRTLTVTPDKVIAFFAVVPLYEQEMTLKLHSGSRELLDRLIKANAIDLITQDRPNVAE